jgi:hypothetical protein
LENSIWNRLWTCRKADYYLILTPFSLKIRHSKRLFIGVILSPLGTAATTGLLYQPQMIVDGDCGVIGGIKIGRGNRSTRRKLALASLCLPQIPHDHMRVAEVGSQRLTA